MQQAQRAGRFPEPLELAADGSIAKNRFDDTPLVSDWGVRPFELATMRLQNLIMQISRYGELGPKDPRCLTQLGGMVVVGAGGEPEYASNTRRRWMLTIKRVSDSNRWTNKTHS